MNPGIVFFFIGCSIWGFLCLNKLDLIGFFPAILGPIAVVIIFSVFYLILN